MGIDWQSLVVAPMQAAFGQPASYQAAAGGILHPLAGVFDEASTAEVIVGGEVTTVTQPTFGFNVADLPVQARQGDHITVPANLQGAPLQDTRYIVRDVRLDGHGWARLFLQRDRP